MKLMHPGLCIRKWVGYIQWRVERTGSGYGGKIWAGSGQMKNFTHFYIKILRLAGFISTEQARSLLFYHYRDERWLQMNKGGNDQ